MSSNVSQSLELVNEQRQTLYRRFLSTSDRSEKTVLLRRLANLSNVKEFLHSLQPGGSDQYYIPSYGRNNG